MSIVFPPQPPHFYCFLPPPSSHFYFFPPAPPDFYCFPSTTTTTTILLFSRFHHHNSVVSPAHTASTSIVSLLLPPPPFHHNFIIFPPPPPPPHFLFYHHHHMGRINFLKDLTLEQFSPRKSQPSAFKRLSRKGEIFALLFVPPDRKFIRASPRRKLKSHSFRAFKMRSQLHKCQPETVLLIA